MAYVTTNDLKNRLGDTLYARLTDRIDGETPNSTVAQALVDQAEALADSMLAVRYATPVSLASRPELAAVLAARVLDLAESLAWRGSPFVSDVPDRVRFVSDQAERWFRDVAAGRASLPGLAPPASPTAQDDSPRVAAGERVLTSEELSGL